MMPGRSTRWAEALDFSGPRARVAWWSWALLGVALLAGLALEHRVAVLEEASGETARELERLVRADRRQRLERAIAAQARPTVPGSVAAPALHGPVILEVTHLAGRLAYPWPAVLQGLQAEAARQQVVLMAVSLDVSALDHAVLRAQGAVQNDVAALRWAAGLPQGQLLGRQALGTPFVARQGRYGMTAEVQAIWGGTGEGAP